MRYFVIIILFVLSSIEIEAQSINVKFSIGDTMFINNPVVINIENVGTLVLTDVNNIFDVVKLVDTSNYKASYRKIRCNYKTYQYYTSLELDIIFTICKLKYKIPFYDFNSIVTYKLGGVEIIQLEPSYLLEFYFNKKSNYRISSENPYNRSNFLIGYTKYGVLFKSETPLVFKGKSKHKRIKVKIPIKRGNISDIL